MILSVVDVNVWLPLLAGAHPDHEAATRWYESLETSEAGMCRVVQLSTIRLLGSQLVMGANALTARDAWERIQLLFHDERVEFLPEPQGLDAAIVGLFRYRQPTPKLVNDAYLAAFALSSGRRMVTFDRGFLEFRGLDVEILGD